jgi:hypothetical protein
MYKNTKISLVIPCYNEEAGIAEILKRISSLFDEVIIVDNASTDGTSEKARRLGAKVVFEKQKGYGQAYAAGFRAASGDIIVAMDGDNSYPIEEAGRLINFLLANDFDFVSGCRFPLQQKNAMATLNKVGNYILTLVFCLITFKKIKDSQSGMWVFKREILKEMKLKSRGMAFSEEIKMEAILNKNIKFAEVPIDYSERIGWVKLKKWKDGLINILFLFKKRIEIFLR